MHTGGQGGRQGPSGGTYQLPCGRELVLRLAGSHMCPAPRTGTVFTDDLAPVEQLIDQIILDYVRSGDQ